MNIVSVISAYAIAVSASNAVPPEDYVNFDSMIMYEAVEGVPPSPLKPPYEVIIEPPTPVETEFTPINGEIPKSYGQVFDSACFDQHEFAKATLKEKAKAAGAAVKKKLHQGSEKICHGSKKAAKSIRKTCVFLRPVAGLILDIILALVAANGA